MPTTIFVVFFSFFQSFIFLIIIFNLVVAYVGRFAHFTFYNEYSNTWSLLVSIFESSRCGVYRDFA